MKKLFLVTLFACGTFLMAQSQSLQYVLYNAGSSTWDFGMQDSGGSGTVYELNITPTQQRNGFIFNFALPLEWKTENNFGCGTSQVETGPNYQILPLFCTVPTYIEYEIAPFGFGNWGLKMALN